MDILWQVVYWGNLIQGSFVTKFYQKYWVSGHFSVASRVKATLKQLLILLIAGLIFLAAIAAVVYYLYKDFFENESFTEYSKAAILVMSNAYGTILLVILLSYGLAFLPFSVWKRSSN